MVRLAGFLCGGGYRTGLLVLRTAHPVLPQSRLAAKYRTAVFCSRSVKSLPFQNQIQYPPEGWVLCLVRLAGFEPASFRRQILSLLCMPFHHNRLALLYSDFEFCQSPLRGFRSDCRAVNSITADHCCQIQQEQPEPHGIQHIPQPLRFHR